ncbi:MAG: hypothetical protein Q8N90_04380 [bacterium]|nr:hypothetical protein [bacterium]
MKKFIYSLLITSVLAVNAASGLFLPAYAQETLPPPKDWSGIIEAAPESFNVISSAAEVLICSSGIYDTVTNLLSTLSRIITNPVCQVFRSVMGTTIVAGECSIDTGGAGTTQACKEWVQRKQAEMKKYLAQVKKILIASYVRRLVDKMAFDVVDWIGGKTTGAPQFITNWEDFIWGTAKESIGDAIQQAGTLSFLCQPFRAQVVLSLSVPQQRPPLPVCTLDTIMTNIEDFYDDFRTGDWVAFNEVVKPQNNPIGAWLMEMENLENQQNRIQEQQALKGQSSYVPTEKCIKTRINDKTGQEECIDSIISIPGQAKSDLTSKALAAQMDKAESYMITESDLLNYAEMIGSAIVSRLVKSAKTAVFGGKEYGEGLLDLPETGDVISDRYSCERAATLAMCVSDPDGTMTKSECDATCKKAEQYRCDTSGSAPTCVGDPSGTMTRAQCETMCLAGSVGKYSCLDVYGSKMCAIDPNGEYVSENACKNECELGGSNYECNSGTGTCSVDPDGPYSTREDCLADCRGFSCNIGTGTCSIDPGGPYSTRTDCLVDCNLNTPSAAGI